ncbi:MAG: DUF2085 domain-containing protein [Phycisphaerae bacterium]
MDLIADIFSHLCGQGRCFVVDGRALPVCQRCLGLYAGAALTMAWLIASWIWRSGLAQGGLARRGRWRSGLRRSGAEPRGLELRWPLSASVLAVNILCLAAAMLGGLHIIDIGPRWRMLCGLWTGHVAVLWLIGASAYLWRECLWSAAAQSRSDTTPLSLAATHRTSKAASRPPHSTWVPRVLGNALRAIAAPVALAAIAAAFDVLGGLGWWFWAVIGAAGVAAVAMSVGAAVASVVRFAWRTGRYRQCVSL